MIHNVGITGETDAMYSPSRNTVMVLIGITPMLHNTEEYLTFPGFFRSPSRLLQWLPAPRLLENTHELRRALITATLLPLVVVLWAVVRPAKPLLVSVLFLESVLLVNARLAHHGDGNESRLCSRRDYRDARQPAI